MTKFIRQPSWLWEMLNCQEQSEGSSFLSSGHELIIKNGIPRSLGLVSAGQEQTKEAFGFKWSKRDTFETGVTDYMKQWLVQKYGKINSWDWLEDYGDNPVILDAGCGASMSGLALFEPIIKKVRYLGVDVSKSVDVAANRFLERNLEAAFIQADLNQMPLPENCVDIIFSEGVLHHTDNTKKALAAVTKHLRNSGRILFYVYRKKGPVREFTDDFIRDQMQRMTPDEGWDEMKNLTELGKALGELNIEIEIPNDINVLEIPKGTINLQRLFYWHVCKAFYRPEMTKDEMTHINYDWFAPRNAHRQSVEEVRDWCKQLNLKIEHELEEEAGITMIAKKTV